MNKQTFSILHIASHASFSTELDQIYVLSYDSKIRPNDLESIVRTFSFRGAPLELLVLSACQTAAGNDQASLGLAGIALKSGARSALASLWNVDDEATSKLIQLFYDHLIKNNLSKAQALSSAQREMKNRAADWGHPEWENPRYWSPYLVIGDWRKLPVH